MTADPESPSEAPWSDPTLWTPVGNRQQPGQRTGKIQGRGRSSAEPVTAGQQNRAGHRLYARVNQARQFRLNILGLGRWRKGRRLVEGEESWAMQTNTCGPGGAREVQIDRRELRPQRIAQDKANRRNGLRPGWRKP
jgi:hypothetical protein